MSSIVISGDTSGSVTLQAPAIAGSTVVTLPTTSMNIGTGGGSVASNTAFGASALAANTSGAEATAIGSQSLSVSTDGFNTAVGFKAGFSQTTGTSNTYLGRYTAGTAATTTGSNNTAVGNRSLQAVTSGAANVSIGAEALQASTTASNNTAIGRSALYSNTTGASNVSLGTEALFANTTASNNTAVGYQALYSKTTGDSNTGIGYQAGYSVTTAIDNTFLGQVAGYSTTGASNTFLGRAAGYGVTSGAKNVIIGAYQGSAAPISATGSNFVCLSDGDANVVASFKASTGYFSVVSTSGAGTNALKYNTGNGAVTYDTSSARYKDNIRNSVYGLSHVMQMRSTQFEYKDTGRSDVGLIAEELDPIIPELVGKNKDGQPDSVSYDRMVSVLVKAIQEQQALITTLTTRITALEAKVGA